MSRILVVCEDAGGARALVPVVRALRQRGDEVDLLLGEVAAQVWDKDQTGHAPPILATEGTLSDSVAEGLQRKPEVVLGASTCWGLRVEALMTRAARDQGIPTLTLLDFPARLAPRLSHPGDGDLQAAGDRILALDFQMQEQLIGVGVPARRIAVTGNPAFDELWLADEEDDSKTEDTPTAEDHILFLSQPIAALFGDDGPTPEGPGYTEVSILRALAPMVAALRTTLVVRPHPREDVNRLRSHLTELPGDVRFEANRPLRQALLRARVVTGMTTIALVEAALIGKTSLSIQLGLRGVDSLWTNRSGLTSLVTTVEGLTKTLANAWRAPAAPGNVRARLSGLGWAPDAASRVLLELDRTIGPS